jgi:hypothetical protein
VEEPSTPSKPDSCTAYSDYLDHFVGTDFLEQRFNAIASWAAMTKSKLRLSLPMTC